MDACDALEKWDDATADERFHMLEELIHDALEEWGFDDVQVVNAPVDGAAAEYDSNVIYLDMQDEAFSEAQDGMAHAYHEAMHAMADQAGLETTGLEQELQAGFLGSRAADEALQGCQCDEPPAESAGGGNAPPFPWRCDLASGF